MTRRNKSLLLGSLLGGLAVFIWGVVSWMVIPRHMPTLKTFSDQQAMTAALQQNAPATGVYLLPNSAPSSASAEERQRQEAEMERQWAQGPRAFVAYVQTGSGSMLPQMLKGLAFNILAALVLTLLILRSGVTGFTAKLVFMTFIAIFAALVTYVPMWNWWGFASDFTLVSIADLVIGWIIGSAVIAKVT